MPAWEPPDLTGRRQTDDEWAAQGREWFPLGACGDEWWWDTQMLRHVAERRWVIWARATTGVSPEEAVEALRKAGATPLFCHRDAHTEVAVYGGTWDPKVGVDAAREGTVWRIGPSASAGDVMEAHRILHRVSGPWAGRWALSCAWSQLDELLDAHEKGESYAAETLTVGRPDLDDREERRWKLAGMLLDAGVEVAEVRSLLDILTP